MGGTYQANPHTNIRTLDQTSTIPYRHPYDIHFQPCHGWTRAITLLDDHRLFRRFPQFASWTKADHVREALYAKATARALDVARIELSTRALSDYGDQGPDISGCVRDHFPTEVQDTLRTLAHKAAREIARSATHWKAAGRTMATWRRL